MDPSPLYEFPPQLLQTIHAHVAQLTRGKLKQPLNAEGLLTDKALRFFVPGLKKLSESFTSERAERRQDYLQNPAHRAAYLLYYLPINYLKAQYVLAKLPEAFWQKEHFHFLDLGCGPATATLAFLAVIAQRRPQAKLTLHLVDQSKSILSDARTLTKQWLSHLPLAEKWELKLFRQDLFRFKSRTPYDFVFLHHVLNEKTRLNALQRAQALGPWLKQHLKTEGYLAVLEPALKRPTRELMAFRDHLIAGENFHVLAPCLHSQACPMLAATRGDWCHFYFNWEEPDSLKKLSHWIETRNPKLKLSYLLLSPSQAKIEKVPLDHFVVVSDVMRNPDRQQVILCGPAGRWRLIRENQQFSHRNNTLEQWQRGALVQVPALLKKRMGPYECNGNFRLHRKDALTTLKKG